MNKKAIKHAIQSVAEETNRIQANKTSTTFLSWEFDDDDGSLVVTSSTEPSTLLCDNIGALSFVSADVEVWRNPVNDGSVHTMWNARVPISRRQGYWPKLIDRMKNYATRGAISKLFIVEMCLFIALFVLAIYFSLLVVYNIFWY